MSLHSLYNSANALSSILARHDKLRKSIMVRDGRIRALERVYNNLPPSNNTASELERLKKEQDDESADFKKLFTKIVECDNWPMAPRPEQGIVENKFTDMMKQVDGMTKNISRLNISVKKKQEELSGPEETPTVTSRKRRRLSDGGLDDSTFNAAELQESVDSAENQLLDLQNQLLNHDNDIQTEVTGLIENRYDELEAARSAGTDPEALFRQSASIRLHTAEQQLAEVAVEMADVINRETGKDEDHEQVKRQNAVLVSDIHRVSKVSSSTLILLCSCTHSFKRKSTHGSPEKLKATDRLPQSLPLSTITKPTP